MAIWPFGRRRDADESAPEPAAAESASPAVGEADVARPERQPTGDWMTLPPVRTTASATMPPTFRVQRLPEILTSHQDARLSGSLGHAVSAEAPSGTVGGLATAAGSVTHGPTGASAELREPRRATRPDTELAAPVQRRLASEATPLTTSGGVASVSSMAPSAPALPEPEVSRVLASPGPVPTPTPSSNPLPVARVVDTARPATSAGAPASSAAPATAPASAAPTTEAAETGLVGDHRVGGFEVDLGTLLGHDQRDDELPVVTPPPDLAPPIQPAVRRSDAARPMRAPVQRAADPGSAAPPSTPTLPSAPSAPETSSTASAPSTASTGRAPSTGSAPSTPSAPSAPSTESAPSAPSAPSTESAPSDPSTPSAPATPAPEASAPGDEPRSVDGAPIQRRSDSDADAAPAPATGGTDRPLAGDDLLAGPRNLFTTDSPAGAPEGARSGELPLVAPAVQRAADTVTAAPGPAAGPAAALEGATPAPDHLTPAPNAVAPEASAAAAVTHADAATPAPSVQRDAEEHFEGDGHDHGDAVQREVDSSATAPLAGESGLRAGPGLESSLAADEQDAADPGGAPASELPLVARTTEPTAPTLGTGGGAPDALPLQTLSDSVASMPGAGTSSLPLAPPEGPGALEPRTPPRSPGSSASTSTGLVGDRPVSTGGLAAPTGGADAFATGSAGGGGSTGTAGRSASVQRQAATASPSMPRTAGGLPLAVQRQAAGGAATAAASSMPTAPLASSAGSLLLATPGGAGGDGANRPSAATPMTVLGGLPVEAPAVPLQRSFDAPLVAPTPGAPSAGSASASRATSSATAVPAASSGAAVPATAAPTGAPVARLPLATPAASMPSASSAPATPVTELTAQRMVTGSGPAPVGNVSASSMPLHTAAASVPSTTDLLVKAGLGEKAPDGSFLRSTPPPGGESSFTVQTMSDPVSSSTPVQRVENTATATPASSAFTGGDTVQGGGSGGGGMSAADVRSLYLKIRSELEADLRRQLEAKSRYNRYRP